ncbi:(2Fe-2S)-binding protein [Paraurantiacibacter namhicola]|uniref:Carbon monoxide dehydrogenase small chain n=1 Tax=Paraurantiacibacter namhicola TaxID=645517 RepID=A0A1C7DAB3_9SPHN|nr:(2Fe-2S)-binding protein [Paraurantiacibacter namhicola]ANU08430.1 Carbon monoxide dehydrogenase small chain [Paraurantiacibacter namhicola]
MAEISLEVNGKQAVLDVPDNTLLIHALRDHLRLTGAHVGCDTSQCGACTVHVDGQAVKSCAMLAVQAEGRSVTTIEGLAKDGDDLHPMQQAFHDNHGLQCGYCTPGMVMVGIDIARRHGKPDPATVRHELEGNLCRCTGYQNIVASIVEGAGKMEGTA